MKLLILRSVGPTRPNDAYSVCMNTSYVDRVIGHLSDTGGYCSACHDECISCRSQYQLDFSDHIAAVFEFPAVVPAIIEEPDEFLPDSVPPHDVLISVAVNEEILFAFLQRFAPTGGVIVPIEESDWISPHGIRQITQLGEEKGIEVAFPKPFCSFDPPAGTLLSDFKHKFRIGRPAIELTVVDGLVTEAHVLCSAPCGATYYIARNLKGEPVDDQLVLQAEKLLSCYPCTAGHTVDSEFKDSIIHQACKILRIVIDEAVTRTVPPHPTR